MHCMKPVVEVEVVELVQGWYEDFEPKSDMKIGRLFLASRDA